MNSANVPVRKDGLEHRKETLKRSKIRRAWKDLNKNKFLLALTLPIVIYTFIFSYLPMFGVIVAFKRYQFNKGILGSDWVGFDNFRFLIESPDLKRIVRNTLGYNAVMIVLGLVAAVSVALLLYEITSKKLLKTYQTIMVFPNFLSWVVVAYMAYAFLNSRSGMFNQLFDWLGWRNIDWYTETFPWIFIFPLASLWKGIGMGSIIYYAALMGIDPTYYEAAKIDGANKWKMVTKISLPFLYPLMTILTILAVGHIFSADFGLFFQLPMNSSSLYATTDVIDTYIYRALIDMGNIGMSSAAGLAKSILGFILVVTTNAVVRKTNPDNSLF